MIYYSTRERNHKVSFREATLNGQPPGGGLYFPEHIPQVPATLLKELPLHTLESLAMQILKPYTGHDIPDEILEKIIEETFSFDFPLTNINDSIYSLELYHGPTLAFKDVGARFMSRCLQYFVSSSGRKAYVLAATSGDTGGAVADGFSGMENIEVIILYPSGKVSALQEKQLTTATGNVHALEVAGSFDDCQRMVREAFADTEINQKLFLTSANSINVARWLPQQLYYFYALQQWPHDHAPVISVPSGNFGNLCAGLLAGESGLPVSKFIAACNANDTVPRFLQSGRYEPGTTIPTISNAMDGSDGAPSPSGAHGGH